MEHKAYTLNDGREIHIRPLKADDRDNLAKFYRSMSEDALRWVDAPSLGQIDEKLRYPDYYISLVTVYDGYVVGYGEIVKDSQKIDGELIIHIHQGYQGVGLGTAMMIMLVKEATDEQLHRINLRVAAGNRRAVQLFLKFGFQEHESKKGYDEESHDIISMSKALKK